MKKNELIAWLETIEGNPEVMIHDHAEPRTINGKVARYEITVEDSDECADCEDRAGETVVLLGFGNY